MSPNEDCGRKTKKKTEENLGKFQTCIKEMTSDLKSFRRDVQLRFCAFLNVTKVGIVYTFNR